MNEDIPVKLRPYVFHKIALGKIHNNEAAGDCPFCGREGKFSVNTLTGQWKCWVCARGTGRGGGNVYTFIREFHALCLEATKSDEFKALAAQIDLLDFTTLVEWQIVKSVTTHEWLIPGYNPSSQLVTLYRQIKQPQGGFRAIPTPTLGHHIHGMNLWDPAKPLVYILEGWKDALAFWECLTRGKTCEERGLCPTASRDSSLYAQANVIAVPGAEVFFETWLPLFENKVVNLLYDSDHPRKNSNTGTTSPGAGWNGMKRVTELLCSSKHKPQEINCVHWGPDGWDPNRKSGFDVRDFITKG